MNTPKQKAEEWFLINQYNQQDMIHSHRIPEYITTKNLWVTGYNQALEDNKEKKYTEEDMRKIFEMGIGLSSFSDTDENKFKYALNHIQPKTE